MRGNHAFWYLLIQGLLMPISSDCSDYGRSQCMSFQRLGSSECGRSNLRAENTGKVLMSPHIPDFAKEDTLLSCAWTITAASRGSLIALRFFRVHVAFPSHEQCWPEYLKIYGSSRNTDYTQEIYSLCNITNRTELSTGFSQITIVSQVRERFSPSLFQIEYSTYRSEKDEAQLRLSFFPIPSGCNFDESHQDPKSASFTFDRDVQGFAEVMVHLCTSPSRNVTFAHLSADSGEVASRWSTQCNQTACALRTSNLFEPLNGNYSFSVTVGKTHSRIPFQVELQNRPRMHTHRYFPGPFRPATPYRFDCDFEGEPVPQASWFFYAAPEIRHCKSPHLPNETLWEQLSSNFFDKSGAFRARKGETHYVCNHQDYKQELELVISAPGLTSSGCLVCWTRNQFGLATAIEPFPVSVSATSDDFSFVKSEEEALVDEGFVLNCSANCFNYESLELSFQPPGSNGLLPAEQISVTGTGVTLERWSNNSTCGLSVHFSKLSAEHNGNYTCTAKLLDLEGETVIRKNKRLVEELNAVSVPVFAGKTSEVIEDRFELTVPRGGQVTLNCSARGKKPLTYRWGRTSAVGQMPSERETPSNESIIVVTSTAELEGRRELHLCTVQNSAGKISRHFHLQFSQSEILTNSSEGTAETEDEQDHLALTLLGVFGALSLAAVIAVVAFVFCWRSKKSRKATQEEVVLDPLGTQETGSNPLDLLWEFPEQKLQLGQKIGHGAYGKVVKARAFGITPEEDVTTVAVKMLKANAVDGHKKALLAELKILIRLGRHLNVVNLLGAVTKSQVLGRILIIVEYCEKGSLYKYLHQHRRNFICQVDRNTGRLDKHLSTRPFEKTSKDAILTDEGFGDSRSAATIVSSQSCSSVRTTVTSVSAESRANTTLPDPTDEPDLNTTDLIKFSFQCSQGMDYIASRKLVHRDLSARNVLLTKDGIIKICDFGLTRDDFYLFSEQQKAALPVRWMAPESLGQSQFTTKSDVWSYGVLLWEMFTLGDTPYTGVPIDEAFYKRLFRGHRLETPDTAPTLICELMRDCWHEDPDRRPTFLEILERLSEFLEEEERNYYVILNAPFAAMNKKVEEEAEEEGEVADEYMNMQGGRRLRLLFQEGCAEFAQESQDSPL